METTDIHQGKSIEILFQKSGLSVTKFAAKIGVSREHVYRIFKSEQIKPYLYESIMKVLNIQETATDGAREPKVSYVNVSEEDRKKMLREIDFLQQRMKDLEEIIKDKNEIISTLKKGNKKGK